MGDLAATPRSKAATAATGAGCRDDWEIWGPNGGYIAVDRAARRGRALALRPARDARRPLPRRRRLRRTVDIEVTTLARGEARRVDARLDDASAASRSSTRWCGRSATSPGSSTTSARCPQAPDPETLPSLAERLDEAAASSRYFRFWANFDERVPTTTGSTTGRTAPPGDPGVRALVPLRARVDVRRPVGRRVPVADPRSTRWAGPRRASLHPRSDVHRAEHRPLRRRSTASRPEEPWLYARGDARRARRTASSAARAACGRATARCSRSARASCSAGPRRADRT